MFRIGMMTENTIDYVKIKEGLKLIKDIGYECADISLMYTHSYREFNHEFLGDDYIEFAKDLKRYADEIGLPLVQCHTPFPVYQPGDEEFNERMFNYQVKCMEICSILGIKNVVIHPWNHYSDEENKEFFFKLLPYAKKYNIVICTENMWAWNQEINKAKPCACSLPESFVNLVNLVNNPNFKACVDIGHAQMFNHLGLTPRILIESLGENVYCLHIHDNDGVHDNHWIPFEGIMDYDDVIKGLKNINYKGDLIVETNLPKGLSKEEAIEFFKKQLEAMKRIKEQLIKE